MSELRSVEEAPSEERTDEPGFTQIVGLTGIGLAVLGLIVVIANQYGPRVLSAGVGTLLVAVGLVGMFYHALRDGSLEVRRAYFWLGLGLLAAMGLTAAVGPFAGDRLAFLQAIVLPPALGFFGLVFASTALRHENDDWHVRIGLAALLIAGTVLAIGSVVLAILKPDTIIGPGMLYGLLGLGFAMAFLSRVDTADGPGYLVATALGVVGGIALLYALGRAIFPTILYEGPPALKNAFQEIDTWKVIARGAIVLLCLGAAAWAALNKNLPVWLRGGLALLGVGFAGVFVAASVNTLALEQPKPFLVPNGLLLGGLGLVYLTFALGIVSDSPLIALTRRELASYFYSPIAYIVLAGMAVLTWVGYWMFVDQVFAADPSTGLMPAMVEPILRDYLPGWLIGPLVVLLLVPALTMRVYSEEKRTGTMEVLLTAPVGEFTIAVSKLLGCWFFFMLTWIPMGLYLIAMRSEGGQPFDYRPLLSLYLAIAVSGLALISMGLFFSSLTKNQVIAAVLTFVGVLVLFMLPWLAGIKFLPGSLKEVVAALSHASYWLLWRGALSGQLPVRDLVLQASMAVFWFYLTVKSLEARKWM